jgi:hypothetical protein
MNEQAMDIKKMQTTTLLYVSLTTVLSVWILCSKAGLPDGMFSNQKSLFV